MRSAAVCGLLVRNTEVKAVRVKPPHGSASIRHRLCEYCEMIAVDVEHRLVRDLDFVPVEPAPTTIESALHERLDAVADHPPHPIERERPQPLPGKKLAYRCTKVGC